MNRREAMALMGGLSMSAFLPTIANAEGKADQDRLQRRDPGQPVFPGHDQGRRGRLGEVPDMTLLNTNANGDANTPIDHGDRPHQPGRRRTDPQPDQRQLDRAGGGTGREKEDTGLHARSRRRLRDCQVNFLETDNVALGAKARSSSSNKLKKRYGNIQGNVVNLVGLIGTTAGDDRDKGFIEEFNKIAAENSELKLVARQEGQFDQEKSFNLMSQIMAANPQIDAVFNGNDDNAVGALRAIRQASKTCRWTIPSTSSSSVSTARPRP